MRIYTRKHVNGGIPIVPMLDILTILLIFFIGHTEFKRQVSVLALDLPQTENLAGSKGESESVLLEIDEEGQIALAGKRLSKTELKTRIAELQQDNPDLKLQLAAAQKASLGLFVDA